MCGHVGFISSFNSGLFAKDVEAFKQMLYIDALRGDDATGICLINKEQGATVLKEGTESSAFLEEGKVEKLLKESLKRGKAFLGHNRKATIGGHKDANAHPFCFEDRYVFFHNGTLNSHKHLADVEVDSEALGLHLTACEGDVDKLGDVFAKAHGAWACVWYDSVKNTVYFVRNAQRPLTLIKTKGGDVAYASEAWIAAGCLARNGMVVDEVIPLKEDTLYSILLEGTKLDIKEEAIPKKAAPSTSKHHGMKATTTGANLSRKAANVLSSTFAQKKWLGFFVDDVVCAHSKPSAAEVYDYLVTGVHPEYPGVVFKSLVKDLFPYEAEEMMEEYVWGKYDSTSYYRGELEVQLTDVSYSSTKGKVCS